MNNGGKEFYNKIIDLLRREEVEEIVLIGKPAVPALIYALKDKNEFVRRDAAWLLGEIAEANPGSTKILKAVPALIKALKDKNGGVRMEAAEALGKIGFDKVPEEKRIEVEVLAFLILNKTDDIVKIGNDAVPILIDALKDEEWRVEWNAVEALVKIGETAVPALIDVLKDKDKDEDVRWDAAKALREIAETNPSSTEISKAVPALIDALKDEGWDVPKGAAETLVKIGETAVPALIDVLKDKDKDVRERAAETLVKIGETAVPALIDVLKDEDRNVRWDAAKALREIAETNPSSTEISKAVPALIDALKDKDGNVQREAAETLEKIGFDKVPEEKRIEVKVLAFLILEKTDKIVSIGNDAVPALIDALKDENEFVRREAAEALGKIAEANPGSTEISKAVPALIDALKDEDRSVRRRAAKVLGKIVENFVNKKLEEKDYKAALSMIGNTTDLILKMYRAEFRKKGKNRNLVKEKEGLIEKLNSLTALIKEKVEQEKVEPSNPLNEKEPIKWKLPKGEIPIKKCETQGIGKI